ncbi:MAG: hypothetical protein KIG20_00425 [Eubacteriales bacterium]|nr:hypothetical protein [Eubacteriales bacterium]
MKKLLTFVLLISMLVPMIVLVGCSVKTTEDEKNKQEAASKFRITVTSSGSACGTVAGGGVYTKGDIIKIEAFPKENYSFFKWGDGNTDNPRMITVTDNQIYKAYFNYTGDCQVSVNVLSIYQGEIRKDEVYGYVEGTGSYKAGSSVTLKAVPEEGCFFVGWGDGCLDAEREIASISANATYRAQFVKADAVYVHEATGYYAAIVGECTITIYSNRVRFTPVDYKNFVGWYEGTNEMILSHRSIILGIYYTNFTKNHFYTLVKTVIGKVSVHAVSPSSNVVEDVQSMEGGKTVDWTYLTDLEEYVKQKGYMMIYFTDFKMTDPTRVREVANNVPLYEYEIDCNKYVNYAMYTVYETSKGVCVDRSDFGSILNGSVISSSYYYRGEKLIKMALVGVK